MTVPVLNAMSIDVEDYFQVAAFAPYIERGKWESLECRVERNIDQILDEALGPQTRVQEDSNVPTP